MASHEAWEVAACSGEGGYSTVARDAAQTPARVKGDQVAVVTSVPEAVRRAGLVGRVE